MAGLNPDTCMQVVYGLGPGQQAPQPAPGMTAKVISLEAVAALGEAQPHAHTPPQPFHIATLCYTSGTTGCAGLTLSTVTQRLHA